MSRLIVYGDIHGCYDKLVHLRNEIRVQQGDIEICVGDVITRGKESIKTLRYLQRNKIKTVLGNHEDKIVRFLNHEGCTKKNPIKLNEDEKGIVKELNPKDIDFLFSLPLFFRLGKIVVLHAGLHNQFDLHNLSKNDSSKILRLRYLSKNGKFVPFGEESDDSVFWSDVYNGEQGFVVYGHQQFENVKISKNSLGIDTGCVYGNKLSGVVFNNPENHKIYKIFSV